MIARLEDSLHVFVADREQTQLPFPPRSPFHRKVCYLARPPQNAPFGYSGGAVRPAFRRVGRAGGGPRRPESRRGRAAESCRGRGGGQAKSRPSDFYHVFAKAQKRSGEGRSEGEGSAYGCFGIFHGDLEKYFRGRLSKFYVSLFYCAFISLQCRVLQSSS
ncbi:unnamed protein product [Chondrus crispus]|uniref:Uncharacterized protein n=1 Tax=Chondrus crispus TaxID=2769 RepID=R7Q5M5_CHOCR|nr:unnamed protein product [Chondrus crispus]CDF32676.1 unnamed protein product [Chondrus crispus]|eukprot:XP_005712447.1 unnamed protein product [Chondrus crispus]